MPDARFLSMVDHDVEFAKDGWQEAYEAAAASGVNHLHWDLPFYRYLQVSAMARA